MRLPPPRNISANIRVVNDTVDGEVKPVVALVAHNKDGPFCDPVARARDPTLPPCHKYVTSAGMITTAAWYASARFEVRAKFPQVAGLVAALWTYRYEVHWPDSCTHYTCYCGPGGVDGCPRGQCMPPPMYGPDRCGRSSPPPAAP